jgi:predicted RNA binding protein YcfA (HicA-like mRNA interferase family)
VSSRPKLTGRQIIAVLEGFRVVRIEGSHHVLTKPGRRDVVTVPVRGKDIVPEGTFHHILHKAALTVRQFYDRYQEL